MPHDTVSVTRIKGKDGGEMRAQEIPWAPECFACGGNGMEMVFS